MDKSIEGKLQKLLANGDKEGAEKLYKEYVLTKDNKDKVLGPCPKKKDMG